MFDILRLICGQECHKGKLSATVRSRKPCLTSFPCDLRGPPDKKKARNWHLPS